LGHKQWRSLQWFFLHRVGLRALEAGAVALDVHAPDPDRAHLRGDGLSGDVGVEAGIRPASRAARAGHWMPVSPSRTARTRREDVAGGAGGFLPGGGAGEGSEAPAVGAGGGQDLLGVGVVGQERPHRGRR
jgi:hypothetical protein